MAYVYWLLIDGVIRYVGKGVGRRAASHVKLAARLNERRAKGEKVKATRFYNALAAALARQQKIAPQSPMQ